jgi:Cap4 SAVED domain
VCKLEVSTNKTNTEGVIERYISSLLRGTENELDAYLVQLESSQIVNQTKAVARSYMLSSNGQEMPRVEDLALKVADSMIDYAIPRSEIQKAKSLDDQENTTKHIYALARKARKLFVQTTNTGEGGELLLYILIQSILKLPKAISKMSLKTSNQVHFHGADGIHIGFDTATKKLQLYWGEAKLNKSVDQAINSCFSSIAPFLVSPGGINDPRTRDMDLLVTNLDFVNDDFEEAILNYLDPGHPSYNSLEYRAACLIGFDSESYCASPFEKTQQEVMEELKGSIAGWVRKIDSGINKHRFLSKFTMEVFVVPFPGVQDFRDKFLEAIS